jgi:hypothetical protein
MKDLINLRRTGNKCINALVELSLTLIKPKLDPGLVSPSPEVKIVRIRKRGESSAKLVDVGAAQGVNANQTSHVKVVVQAHNVSDLVALIQTACGVGDDDGLDAKQLANTSGECGCIHGVAFVEVCASDEQCYGCLLRADLPEDKLACVTSDYISSSVLPQMIYDIL